MNDRMLQDIEREIAVHSKFEKDITPHHILGPDFPHDNTKIVQEPISEITRRIDRSDVHRQAEQFTALLRVEIDDTVSQLRHRADMMRRRAQEFDALADQMVGREEQLHAQVHWNLEDYEQAKSLIATHAHIKPEKG